MNKDLDKLLEQARKLPITPENERDQRQSFVYGNTFIENDRITREMVAEIDNKLTSTGNK